MPSVLGRRGGSFGAVDAADSSLGRRGGTGDGAAAGAGDLTPETLFRSASRRLNGLSLIDGGELAIGFQAFLCTNFLHNKRDRQRSQVSARGKSE